MGARSEGKEGEKIQSMKSRYMTIWQDRFYPDAFRYYAYALQATGENEKAELALRRAQTLDPREAE